MSDLVIGSIFRPFTLLAQLSTAQTSATANQPTADTAAASTSDLPQTTGSPTLDASMDNFDPAQWEIANGYTNASSDPNFNNGWQANNITFNNGIMTIQLDDAGCPSACSGMPYASGEYRSDDRYGHGLLQGRFQAASGDGLVTSLFFYRGLPGDKNDEIDIEILGKNPTRMQVNYWTNGVEHPHTIDLGFDASQGFHDYAILRAPDYIAWYVDERLVHVENGSRGPLPTHQAQIMMNLWPGSSEAASWLRSFNYAGPVQAQYDRVSFTPIDRITLPPQPPTVIPTLTHAMPPGFTSANTTPEDLIDGNSGTISGSKTREREYIDDIGIEQGFWEEGAPYRIRNDFKRIFRERIIQWMLLRVNGDPSADNILKNMPQACIGNTFPYWKAKVAHLIVSGNPTEIQLNFLKRLGFVTEEDHFSVPLSKSERFTILERIYNFYKGSSAEIDLIGQIQLQLSFLSPDETIADGYRAAALQVFNTIINSHLGNPNQNPIKQAIKSRMSYLSGPQSQNNINREYNLTVGEALKSKAQILLHQAGESTDPAEALGQLLDAFKLLRADDQGVIPQADPLLNGPHYQELKQLAAECFVRIGFMAKDFEDIINFPPEFNSLLAELQTWEGKNLPNTSVEKYQVFFRAAQVLIGGFSGGEDTVENGVPGESVFDWEKTYNDTVHDPNLYGPNAAPSLWIKQISAFAKIWLANLHMVKIGEDRREGEDPKIYLRRQKNALVGVEVLLAEILGSTDILDEQVVASVKRTLAENLARQAFISMDFGEDYAPLFAGSKDLLDQAIAEGRPVVAAEARLWRAKILLVEVGKVETEQAKDQLLEEAKGNVLASFAQEDGEYLLKWSILSSAFQTYGDILLAGKDFAGAETRYRQALGEDITDPIIKQLFEKNYFARASLGDVLNWRSRYDEALAQYRKVDEEAPANHPTHLHAQLGMHEAASRKMENYQDMLADEELFKKIFAGQAPASPLIARAVDDLVEAWGTSESLYANIVWVGNKLLGLETPFDVPENSGDLFRTLEESQAILSNHAKAALFLDVAETLMRMRKPNDPDRRFEDANRILPIEPGQTSIIPSNIRNLIENNLELKLSYHLLIAELKMKRERDVHLLINARIDGHDLIGAIFDSKDPDLVSRVIFDQLEGYSYHEEFSEMIRVARHYLEPENLEKVQKMYADLGRELHFPKFKFKLWKRLAEALTWDKQYPRALLELDAIYAEAQSLESTLPAFARLIQAQVHVTRGDIYRYEWNGQDFEESENNYLSAVELLTAIPRRVKEENVTLAQALFGLGEVYRYGKGTREFRDHDESLDSYRAAEAFALTLPMESDERYFLLAQIYLGMAKLEEMYGNPNPAYAHIQNSANNLDLVYHPTTLLKNEIDHSFNEIATRVGLTVDPTFQMIHGQDGRTEFQITAGTQLPLRLGDNHLLRLNLELQLDMTPDTAILTPYFGGSYTGFFEHGSFSVGLETRFPFLNDWVGNIGTGNGTRFFLRPDLRAEMLLWTDYLTLGGRVAINDLANITDTGQDSWSASLNMNFAWTENRWAEGLRLALLEYNSYPYFWDGEFHRLHTLGFGLHYNVDIIKDLWNFHVDFLKLVNLGEGANQGFLPFEASVGTEFTIGRYFNFGVNYTRQQTVEYPLDMFGLWFRIVH